MSSTPASQRRDPAALGLIFALSAFLSWGAAPIYFKMLGDLSALEIVCHRTVWSVVFTAVVVLAVGRPTELLAQIRSPRRFGILVVTTFLISANWLTYIWAVGQERIVETSLGYYINPLVNVLLGVVFLGERLNARQTLAVGLALAGVLVLVAGVGGVPWIALWLAVSFGIYSLLRKTAGVDPIGGVLVEMVLVAPLALGWLVWLGAHGEGAFGTRGFGYDLLLAAAGVVTAAPLVLFNLGAQRMRLSTIGLLQYLSPTMQLLLGTLVYGEAFTLSHAAAFLLIWIGLAVYSSDAFRAHRLARAAAAE